MAKYCEIVKSVFLYALFGDDLREYKIEIYKKNESYLARLFKNQLLKCENRKTTELVYVSRGEIVSISGKRYFDSIEDCLNSALEKIEETDKIVEMK